MKCKHGNADHLMPGMFSMMMDGSLIPTAQCEQFRCIDCGAWLSLGESNDADPAVQVEIRAAEIAALAHDGLSDARIAHHLYDVDPSSWYGWCQHVAVHHHNDKHATVFDSERAGYLARCITQHPASTGGDGGE